MAKKKEEKPVLMYGPVLVIAGKHKGKVGYYDDNEDDERGNDKAVVYFGEILQGDFELIPEKNLVNTDVSHLPLEKFKKDNPELAATLGVP